MTTGIHIRMCFFVLFGLALSAQGAKVTPMEKVIVLLKDLSAKVAAEGKKDAAEYDKMACFCKEQADEKLYAIETSTAQIADLSAQIEELDTAISLLNSDIGKLSRKITNLEGEIKTKTETREGQHEKYLAKAKDMNEAIAACTAAIEALRDSKSNLKGAKVDLLQVTGPLLKAVEKHPSLKKAATSLLSKVGGKAAPKFEYQSNDIIATLEALNDQFKGMKKELDLEEFDINSSFEKNRLALQNEKQFAEEDRAEKEAIVESKTETVNRAREDKTNEQADKDADDSFMTVLTAECEEKAQLFDRRSSTRADEMKALSEATAELEKGAVPNFSANKKLVGFQKASKSSSSPATFVQIQSVQHQDAKKNAVLQQIRTFLAAAASRTGSQILSTVSLRVNLAEDHFVKVRQLIKDLVAKLEADAEAEATQKGFCDKNMAAAIKDRDDANGQIEAANAKITTETATKNALEDEINTLNKQISELKKALLEATELRDEEKAENTKTMSMTADGVQAVKTALEILSGFYDNAFVQKGKYTPPKSDRDGNTVGDLAPKMASSEYKGSQSESKGIVGILEVILSDFERSNKQAEDDEKEGTEAFEKFEKDTNDDVTQKGERIEGAEGEVADANGQILEGQESLSEAKKLLDSGLEKLASLEVMCVKGEETWEERKKKREDEIEALKSALQTLEEWQN